MIRGASHLLSALYLRHAKEGGPEDVKYIAGADTLLSCVKRRPATHAAKQWQAAWDISCVPSQQATVGRNCSARLESTAGLLVQQVAAGEVESPQVAGGVLRALKVQAEVLERAQAEPAQAQRGRQRDADARGGRRERREVLQVLGCTHQAWLRTCSSLDRSAT